MSKLSDQQLLSLPKKVRFCTKCVISNQRPRIVFDKDGVCSACHYAFAKYNKIDWKKRQQELLQLLDAYRRRDGAYDVIVPASGGKDSGTVAHRLKHEYGMHPLTVTFSPFLYTDIGWQNFQNFVKSGFDNMLGSPNGQVYRKLARLSFEYLGDAWQPFAFGQMSFAFRVAARYGIKLVFFGEHGEVEYGGSIKNIEKPGMPFEDWANVYFKGITPEDFLHFGFSKHDLWIFSLPPIEEIRKAKVVMQWFGYYHKWIPQENYYYATEHTGFQANPEGRSEGTYSKYASLDDKTDGFHYYMAFIKFGIGRATSDAAHEIRDGHITREEGIRLVHRYDGEFPKKYFPEFLEYLDLTEDEFWRIVDKFRAPHIWKKEKGVWKLRHQLL